MMQIPFYKRLVSYFYPLIIRKGAGSSNSYLEIILYRNQFQLATRDALYSDGDRYTPALTAVSNLRGFLPYIKTVLVLGAGLCSMVHVMRRRDCDADFTLVEKDKVVLEWAMESLTDITDVSTDPVCEDAETFMDRNSRQYDLVFLDVFTGRVVPPFVYSERFLEQCKHSITPGGHLAFNYIVNSEDEWVQVQKVFTSVFPENKVVKSGVNRVMIGERSA